MEKLHGICFHHNICAQRSRIPSQALKQNSLITLVTGPNNRGWEFSGGNSQGGNLPGTKEFTYRNLTYSNVLNT